MRRSLLLALAGLILAQMPFVQEASADSALNNPIYSPPAEQGVNPVFIASISGEESVLSLGDMLDVISEFDVIQECKEIKASKSILCESESGLRYVLPKA